jgi:putative hemolysin
MDKLEFSKCCDAPIIAEKYVTIENIEKTTFFCSDCDEIIDYPGMSARIDIDMQALSLESCNEQGGQLKINKKEEL